jgi:hypothetical protein
LRVDDVVELLDVVGGGCSVVSKVDHWIAFLASSTEVGSMVLRLIKKS